MEIFESRKSRFRQHSLECGFNGNRKDLLEIIAIKRSELGLQIPIICSGDMPFGPWRPAGLTKNTQLTFQKIDSPAE